MSPAFAVNYRLNNFPERSHSFHIGKDDRSTNRNLFPRHLKRSRARQSSGTTTTITYSCQRQSPSPATTIPRYPSVFSIRPTPTTRASAFLISPTTAVTTLHPLPPSSTTLQIDNQLFQLTRSCEDADIAIFRSTGNQTREEEERDDDDDDDDEYEERLCDLSSKTSYSLFLPGPDADSIPMKPVEIGMRLCSFSGALVPFLRLEHEYEHDQLHGWSGCPIVRDDTHGVVGVLVQGDEYYAEAIPSPLLLQLLNGDQNGNGESLNFSLTRLPKQGLTVQPLLHSSARNALYASDDDADTMKVISRLPRVCRVSEGDKENEEWIEKNDLLHELNGRVVAKEGYVDYAGIKSPLDTCVVSMPSTWTHTTAQVVRDRQLPGKEVYVRTTKARTIIKGSKDKRLVYAGGMIFAPLTTKILKQFPSALTFFSMNGSWPCWFYDLDFDDCDTDVVVLIAFDEDEWSGRQNLGLVMQRVVQVDGKLVTKLEQLVKENGEIGREAMMDLEFSNGFLLAVERGFEMTMPDNMLD